ncbi:serine/threonine protein phosphatase [Deinococcus seoulensis]|uniref:Serine/threonine protein phosphatase n=1 Tax=Deinococcus seoulensis TaxID=1837379 RepID=A0ABQ2RSD1_9DEIO|nr:metallophosphoesterase [Deinococcus seoulensis]GGR62292.1 serine/threonine protein phosphatase [Deinococcus seoulensis]
MADPAPHLHPDPATLPPVAIGDIHGRLDLLDAAIAAFPSRKFVLLGDYTDRGPDSAQVIARVRALVDSGRATALCGNHDQMLIDATLHDQGEALWDMNGGDTTLDSYGGNHAALLADAQWMDEHLLPHTIIGSTLYAHAMRPDPTGRDLYAHTWGRPDGETPFYPLPPGVTHSVHGHTVMQYGPVPLQLTDGTVAWFIDTGAVFLGTLTALDTATWIPHLFSDQTPATPAPQVTP